MGHLGSKTRSLGQFLKRKCVHSRRHSFDPIFMKLCQNFHLFSSPVPRAPGDLIGWQPPWAVRRPPSTFSKDFLSETTGPISFKFPM